MSNNQNLRKNLKKSKEEFKIVENEKSKEIKIAENQN